MKYFLPLTFLALSFSVFSQQVDILLDKQYEHFIDRIDIKNPSDFTSVKPYNRADIINRIKDTLVDPLNNNYLLVDNALFMDSVLETDSRKPILNHFYSQKANFYQYKSNDFIFAINPMCDLKIGGKTTTGENLFLNSRGVEIKGSINNKIGFYSMLSDNQGRFSDYVSARFQKFGAISGENFWKADKSYEYDFFSAKGYLTFNATKNIHVKFGYDKNFIGDGYRSLLLSDYSGNYTHLKITTKIWKFNYTNIFADMTADLKYSATGSSGAQDFPRKFVSMHHLSFNLRKNLNVGFFESIVVGGADSTGIKSWNINYLNPVIFYRAIESNLGSGSNALIGGNFKWNFLGHFSLYGQGILDEFLFSHIKAQDGWWANKYGGQLGIKYIDVANIKGLDLQLEGNAVRPFTYSHTAKNASYTNFNQSLAHPLGSNFNEILSVIRYQPHPKVFITAKFFKIAQGLDMNGDNYGSNPLSPNATRKKELGNTQLQGNLTRTTMINLQASYRVKHNIFIDADVVARKSSDSKGVNSSDKFINLGLRMNLPNRLHEF